ncbi:MAG: CDP-alcohol phosphatidyltransferase family protein [Chloroflexi bacterium]|nr:CDP-alcohol phosphatidyltransferase family protein [Chloroflexota bacterium]
MLSERLRRWSQRFITPMAVTIGKLGLSPNMLTILGFLLNMAVASVLASGTLRAGGVLVILASLFDTLDGAVARATNRVSVFGAFFDSVLDRYSEAALYFGLLVWYIRLGFTEGIFLVYATLIGSFLVSYTRARAEGVGIECREGWFTRFERLTVLILGLLTLQLRLALWVLAICSNLTAVQRIWHVWQATRQTQQ